MEDDHASIVLTAITLNKEGLNDRRQITGKDVDVQTDLISITPDDEKTNFRRQLTYKDVGVQVELIAIMLDNQETHLTMNKEETLDVGQVVTMMENLGEALNDPMTKNRRVVEAITEESTLTTTNIINNITTDLGPIVGYAKEPLLPLFKACAPLTNILHNLSFYIQIALNETPEQPPHGLTIDESAAIRLYTIEWDTPHRSLYSALNHTLKFNDREQFQPYFKYIKLF
jgi:hypothetical protein